MIPNNYVEKVYAGFLGMNVGIRLGAPVEAPSWTYERIRDVFGDITDYTKPYKTFAADDDANGPVFFLRALYDDAKDRELTPDDVGKAWLNYSREGIGMFWWGGEGVSTEHTAYMNLSRGIPAPKSGSIEMNGLIEAEQIGGQIFIDTWGLVLPGDVEKAADYAEIAASVSHDGNGLYGARFMAACISKAFDTSSISDVVDAGLRTIPKDSTYAQLVRAVVDFHAKYPNDFRACRQYLEEEWGYDKYTGVCHIIPNAGVCVLSLLYGEGNFARTIEIATMCGWDTDCNAGNVGTIVGVMGGIEGIPMHYRKPINDFICTSSVSGYLNVLDIPTFSKEVALFGYKLFGEQAPQEFKNSVRNGELYFDFALPGSTHGFRTDNTFKALLHPCDDFGYESNGSLKIVMDRMIEGDESKVFYKPFYRRNEFSDEKYKPTFAPTVYSGQQVTMKLFLDKWEGEEIFVIPYVRNTYTKEIIRLARVALDHQAWNDVNFVVPDTEGAMIDEIGFIISSPSPLSNRALGAIYLGQFHVHGNSKYEIDLAKQSTEFLSITPFSHHRGEWQLNGETMTYESSTDCSSYTGNYYSSDYTVETTVTPEGGTSHGVIFRAEGIRRHYFVGFNGEGTVSLLKNDFGYSELASATYNWKYGEDYKMRVSCIGEEISFFLNGVEVLKAKDNRYSRGMFGFGTVSKGKGSLNSFIIEEKQQQAK
ncbi:ADP-ribosylglycohydrolase family protein [Sutcliffiella horikoshii]|uniref:ADP-ribosylglycohydrolase family protein n=1 Tax=Sutcliffiella horikoshii TaxID=79883 RepID=UPI003CE971F2